MDYTRTRRNCEYLIQIEIRFKVGSMIILHSRYSEDVTEYD